MLVLLPALLAACANGAKSPSQLELENIAPWNVVPKSTPRQFVDALQRICLAPSTEAARKALRLAGYVKAPTNGAVETYLVDNRKPAVQFLRQGRQLSCAITAQSRTGQTDAVHDFVAARFPDATVADIGQRKVEHAWHVADSRILILLTRQRTLSKPSRLMVIIQRNL